MPSPPGRVRNDSSPTGYPSTGTPPPVNIFLPGWVVNGGRTWTSKWADGTLTREESFASPISSEPAVGGLALRTSQRSIDSKSTSSKSSNSRSSSSTRNLSVGTLSTDVFLPLYVVNNGQQTGTNVFIMEVTDPASSLGFSQETYVLKESWDTTATLLPTSTPAERQAYIAASYRVDGTSQPNRTPKFVTGSTIKEAIVIIEDAQGPAPLQLNSTSNTYSGSAAIDVVYGGGGNDTLNGNAGNDTFRGEAGNDTLKGEGNDDVLLGDSGNDTLYGGNETPPAGAPPFSYHPINGDYLNGGSGSDILYGEDGWDTLNGAAGNDTLFGGKHVDVLRGGAGADSLNGDAGNDALFGGAGSDSLTGGTGSDRFIYDTGAIFAAVSVGVDTITDFVKGSDKIVLDKTTFSRLTSAAGSGFSVAGEFAVVNSDGAAATSGALIVFNQTNGKLFYNENSSLSGLGTGAHFATFNPALAAPLAASDFVIQA